MKTKVQRRPMPKAVDVANYYVLRSDKDKIDITNKKVNKLVYFAQAFYLANYKKVLFKDPLRAWIHGPVVKAVYDEFKNFGWCAIDPNKVNSNSFSFNEKEIDCIEKVWSKYGVFNGDDLEMISHEDLSWQRARNRFEVTHDDIINIVELQNEYEQKIQ